MVASLKNSESKDIYFMSNSFVKRIINWIIFPLTFCLNLSIRQGIFPRVLKMSRTVPVHKKGSRDLPENFRPISILPIFSKIFEAVIQRQLYNYFERNHLLADTQFGFRAGLSTVDAVDKLVDDILSGYEGCGFTGVTLCDLSKAFDTVDHCLLILKLKYYGIHGVALRLMESYLGAVSRLSL